MAYFPSCNTADHVQIVRGVSEEIAHHRKALYFDIRYHLFFDIPDSTSSPIPAELDLTFEIPEKPYEPLILDFNVEEGSIHSITIDMDSIPFSHENEHVIIHNHYLKKGTNEINIQFTAGELSLNRNKNYLYTLFVPDRASTVFPCFDQPDMKARFTLILEIPETWQAVSNYSLKDSKIIDSRKRLIYNETAPLPTYLFAFAAGEFKKALFTSAVGMPMTMYYRETDTAKVASNKNEIFRLHEKALEWMEAYTGIEYPFEKFDFVLIPTFQYGGMEHPGSIFYRERSLFLEEASTLNDKLGRASLISHETAHIWFGDLVTMKWFNDVWSKEVFANFMADKIVNPSFGEINHELKFLFQHYPSAYGVDRTMGANAIRQPLDNLKNAGLMYGPIIYNKAPAMMKHLEKLTGERAFQYGMQDYLKKFKFNNATWDDLIQILDTKTDKDLTAWSNLWIEGAGMPRYTIDRTDRGISINQKDPLDLGRVWMQELKLRADTWENILYFDSPEHTLEVEASGYILMNGEGTEYGSFVLDDESIDYFLSLEDNIEDSFLRGCIWMDLYESFLEGRISPEKYIASLSNAIKTEGDPQLLNYLLSQLRTVFWKFLLQPERLSIVDQLESILLDKITNSGDLGIKMSLYKTYVNIFLSDSASENLRAVLVKRDGFMGIPLALSDYTALSMQVSLRSQDLDLYRELMETQLAILSNPDRINRLKFIMPAVSPEQQVRDDFFDSLKDPVNRQQEPWVLTALSYLHHPLRQTASLKYLKQALNMTGDIQKTGDIFFPGRWLDTTLGGHQSEEALVMVEEFIESDLAMDLDPKLRLKVLVASDLLKRTVLMQQSEDVEIIKNFE